MVFKSSAVLNLLILLFASSIVDISTIADNIDEILLADDSATAAAGSAPSRVEPASGQRGVLQLLQRTNLDANGRRLGGEFTLLLRERVDAATLLLRRNLDRRDFQQTQALLL